jgi:hypothetical protein
MAAIHNEKILTACSTLNPGESYVLNFPTTKDAHNEYCYFRTALRSIVQKNAAAKSLTISRNASSVVISMGYPAFLYPELTKLKTSDIHIQTETSQDDLSSTNQGEAGTSSYQRIIDRINADLVEGLISPDEAKEAIENFSACNPTQEL